ncbi:hypothetical protein GRAN_0963 [Granulicella sibirica]|uniref:Uncharacterized protein n=1 Tax=Granulicella sibirica TaxID=2479048 RepID=A0A4Q0T233_9BACT|nr:hypothetical protein GRAN_0963 [Granulicella sibirica]
MADAVADDPSMIEVAIFKDLLSFSYRSSRCSRFVMTPLTLGI